MYNREQLLKDWRNRREVDKILKSQTWISEELVRQAERRKLYSLRDSLNLMRIMPTKGEKRCHK